MIIEIPGQTRSKKNNKRILGRGTKKWIGASALYMSWAKKTVKHMTAKNYSPWTGTFPVEIRFFVYRETKRRFDVDNIFCGSLDILEQMGIIPNDDMMHAIPIFSGWTVDKLNPRVVLQLSAADKTYFREDLCQP